MILFLLHTHKLKVKTSKNIFLTKTDTQQPQSSDLFLPSPVKRRSQSVATLQYNSTRGSLALRVMAKLFSKDGGENQHNHLSLVLLETHGNN